MMKTAIVILALFVAIFLGVGLGIVMERAAHGQAFHSEAARP